MLAASEKAVTEVGTYTRTQERGLHDCANYLAMSLGLAGSGVFLIADAKRKSILVIQ